MNSLTANDALDPLIRLVDHWATHRVVVVGDYMLDRYVYGHADRLSPDAPVPVLAAQREEAHPGGAANACLDLRALRCDVACVGVVGADETAGVLRNALADAGCDVSGLVATPDRPTTVKHNFVGLAQHRHPQKMFRVDQERRDPVTHKVAQRLLSATKRLLKRAAVLCLEDYNKGVLTQDLCRSLITLATQMGVPVLVDPAAISDYRKYTGATCLTPNRTEALLATPAPGKNASSASPSTENPGSLGLAKASTPVNKKKLITGSDPECVPEVLSGVVPGARTLLKKLRLQAVVVTLDKHGALLMERRKPPRLVPTRARAVYDVTGAGDMVLATIAAARANGADWFESVQLANVAAGLEVERFGVVPIALHEVLLALLQRQHEQLGKLRKLDQLLPELAAYRKQGKKIALTNGCFDILHAGHVALLRGARQTADLLVLAVNTDLSIRRLKGQQRPIVPQQDRLELLRELECVDYLILFGDGTGGEEDTPIPLIRAIQPDVLVKGGTYRLDEVVGGDLARSLGGKVVTIPPIRGRSTTNIVQRIQAQANAVPRS